MYLLDDKNCHSLYTYNEIFQSLTIKFAFALINKKTETITPIYLPAKCREYLGDVVWSMESQKPSNIYSFTFDPKKTPITKSKTILYVEYPNVESRKFALDNINVMNHYEFALGFDPSLVVEVNAKGKLALAYIGDKMWQKKSFAISYYSLLIKGMARKLKEGIDWRDEICKVHSNETSLLKSIPSFKVMDNLLYKLIKMKGNSTGYERENYKNVFMTHGASGFHTIFRSRCKTIKISANQIQNTDYYNIYIEKVQKEYEKENLEENKDMSKLADEAEDG